MPYEEFFSDIESASSLVNGIGNIFSSIATIIGVGTAVVSGIIFLIVLVISLAIYYLEAIPVFIIAKKHGFKNAWMALIPIHYCITYVLSCIPGEREIKAIKWSVKSNMAFIIYLLVAVVGKSITLIIGSFVVGMLSIIPIYGTLLIPIASFLIDLAPTVVCLFFEYAFLRDFVDMYNPDKKANNTTSLVVVIINHFCKIVRPIYLWTFVKKTPIEKPVTAEFMQE